MRIALLSEVPDEWIGWAETWMKRARTLPGGASVDPRTLYFLLQTLVGAWPISHQRLCAYLLKAVQSYEMALRYKPEYPQVHYDLGVAYYRLSELKLTEPYMAQILKTPDAQKNYFAKGVSYFPQDMIIHSMENFNHFIAHSEDGKLKTSAMKVLANLEKQLKDLGGKVVSSGGHG